MLEFIIGRESGPPSFNPINSDSMLNALHIEQVVGTLVRMAPNGRYEGYIADKWAVSEDGLRWQFEIKTGLTCDDGTPINAGTFMRSLKRMIRLMGAHSELPLIDHLENFSEFRSGISEMIGLNAKDNDRTLEFQFARPVHSGFLEYVALPIMGFYCEANFKADGTWKDDVKIISSSAFKVSEWDGSGPVTLKRRPEWPISGGSVNRVVIHRRSIDPGKLNDPRTVTFSTLLTKEQIESGAEVVRTLPTIFHSIVLSTERSALLRSPRLRQAVRNAIYSVRNKMPPQIPGMNLVDKFYPHLSKVTSSPNISASVEDIAMAKPLEILVAENPGLIGNYFLSVATQALENLGLPFKIIYSTTRDKALMEYWRDSRHWDLKIANVDIGGGIENQLIKFMFCSKLGVSFPDPSGRIYALVEEFENRYGDSPSDTAMLEYVRRFDQIIDEDAAVIPLGKSGGAWIISKDLDPSFVSPTMGVPYFDLVKSK